MNFIRIFIFVYISLAISFLHGQNLSIMTAPSYSYRNISPTNSSGDASDADAATGGRINSIAITSDGTNTYAASEWGGVFMSPDGGQNWRHLEGHLPHATWDVEVDPADDNKIVVSSLYDGRVNSIAGLNISLDGGETWTHPADFLPPAGFCLNANAQTEHSAFGVAIDPDDSDHIVVGTNCGLAVSTDGGLNWEYQDVTPDDPADNVFDVIIHNDGIIDIIGDDGHFRFTPSTGNWTTTTGAPLATGISTSLAVSPHESNVIFATSQNRVWESDNGGTTWTRIGSPVCGTQGRLPFVKTNEISNTAFDLWFGDVGLFRARCTSNPSGGGLRCPVALNPGFGCSGGIPTNWFGPFTRTVGGHDDVADILFDPTVAQNACPILFASDGGIYLNTASSGTCNTPAWEQPTITPTSLWLFGMKGVQQASTAERLYAGAQDNGVYGTLNAGSSVPTWTNPTCCDGFDFAPNTVRVLYTKCCRGSGPANRLRNNAVDMSSESLVNLAALPPGNFPTFVFEDGIEAISGNEYVIVTTSGIFYTNNFSTTTNNFVQLGSGSTPPNLCSIEVAIAGSDTTFYLRTANAVGSCDSRNPGPREAFKYEGTGTGGSWTQVNTPDGTGGFGVFTVDEKNPNRLMASHLSPGNQPNMILSDDGGTSWTTIDELNTLMTGDGDFVYQTQIGPSNFFLFAGYSQPSMVAFDPHNSNILLAGGINSGIFISLDAGVSWRLISDPRGEKENVPHIPRPRFAHFDTWNPLSSGTNERKNIYIGTQGRGVFKISLTSNNFLTPCFVNPSICDPPIMDRGIIVLECHQFPCRIIDPLPQNCLVKFDCPGCEGVALCPPYYHLILEGLPIDAWQVSILDPKGHEVRFERFVEKNRVVLSFRPSKELFKEKAIGDYYLGFYSDNKKFKGEALKIQTSLEVSERPYQPNGRNGKPLQ